jgi:F420-non-reducing hydrogenase iron-sulfur subunit
MMTMNSDNGYDPRIIVYTCYWCAYTAADLAGTSRLQYPPNVRLIRVQCSGMVHPNLVIDALTNGADGVLIAGCHPGDCHYREGNLRAKQRADAIDLMLEDFDLEPQRFRLEWIAASEGPRFVEVVSSMVDQIKQLGPSVYS